MSWLAAYFGDAGAPWPVYGPQAIEMIRKSVEKTTGVFKMSLQDNLTAAHAAVDAANTALTNAQAALDAAQPHLSVLDEIAAEAAKLEGDAQNALIALVIKAKSLF
jgi:hypothetical protein